MAPKIRTPFLLLSFLFPSLVPNKCVFKISCEAYQLGKHHRATYNSSFNKNTIPFSLIHIDVWGPSPILNGYKWFITFIDDYARTTWVYLMKDKSDVFSIFKAFHKMISTQFSTIVKIVRLQKGKEYIYGGLTHYFTEYGMIHQTSCTNTPQQNGVAEQKNCQLLESARSMMFSMQVPKSYWGEAVLTTDYLINRLPTLVLG